MRRELLQVACVFRNTISHTCSKSLTEKTYGCVACGVEHIIAKAKELEEKDDD